MTLRSECFNTRHRFSSNRATMSAETEPSDVPIVPDASDAPDVHPAVESIPTQIAPSLDTAVPPLHIQLPPSRQATPSSAASTPGPQLVFPSIPSVSPTAEDEVDGIATQHERFQEYLQQVEVNYDADTGDPDQHRHRQRRVPSDESAKLLKHAHRVAKAQLPPMSRKPSNKQRVQFSQSNQFEEVSAPPAVLQASMVDQFSINEMRIRLAQEEADRVALEEHIFLLERRNQSILVELQTLRIEKQQLLAQVQQLESKAHHAHARQPNNEQQMTALYMDVHRLRAERDDARRQLMSVAKSAEPDFLQSYLQLENDFNGLLAEKASLQQRVVELSRFEQQLIQHKLDTAELREQYDDLDFRVRHELEPHIELMDRELAARENTIHYLHQMLAAERQKNSNR